MMPKTAEQRIVPFVEKNDSNKATRRWICAVVVGIAIAVCCYPRFPRWQIKESKFTGFRWRHRPRIVLDQQVIIEQRNFVPLELLKDASFAVTWPNGEPLGTGVIRKRHLTRPTTLLELQLEVPTRASVGSQAAIQFGSRRYLELDVETFVEIKAFWILHFRVAVRCAHIILHTFRGPLIKAARCAYTLINRPLLRSLTTVSHEWTVPPQLSSSS